MNKFQQNSPFRIRLVLIEGFAMMSFSSIVEPLRAANLLSKDTMFEIICHSLSGNYVSSSFGAMIPSTPLDPKSVDCDLALIIAGGDPFAVENPSLFAWLRLLNRRNIQIGGISGGPVIMAKAGLMSERRMTVHWEHGPALKELFPELLIEPSLYVVDRNRVTCAGGTAPMDYAHLLITELYRSEFARLVSDWFMHTEIRKSEGVQRSGLIDRYGTRCRLVLEAIEAMEAHIADPLPLLKLAGRVGVSNRQLSRQFTKEIGQPIMDFYRNLRLDIAVNLLQSSSLKLTDVAIATGFADLAHFSKSWKARWGISPSQSIRNKSLSQLKLIS